MGTEGIPEAVSPLLWPPTLGAGADAIPGGGNKAGDGAPHSWLPAPKNHHGFHMSPHRLSLGEWGTPNVHESQGRGLPPPHSAVHSRERTDGTVNRGWACGTRCCKQPQTEPGVKLLKCLRVGGQVANSFPFPVTRVLGLFRSNCFPHT